MHRISEQTSNKQWLPSAAEDRGGHRITLAVAEVYDTHVPQREGLWRASMPLDTVAVHAQAISATAPDLLDGWLKAAGPSKEKAGRTGKARFVWRGVLGGVHFVTSNVLRGCHGAAATPFGEQALLLAADTMQTTPTRGPAFLHV